MHSANDDLFSVKFAIKLMLSLSLPTVRFTWRIHFGCAKIASSPSTTSIVRQKRVNLKRTEFTAWIPILLNQPRLVKVQAHKKNVGIDSKRNKTLQLHCKWSLFILFYFFSGSYVDLKFKWWHVGVSKNIYLTYFNPSNYFLKIKIYVCNFVCNATI